MKALKIVTAVVLALGLSAGCSEPTTEVPNNGTDAGSNNNGGNDAGSNNNNNNNNGDAMRINALDLVVTNLPAQGEGSGVAGVIIVKSGSNDVTDATVTVNDVPVTYSADDNGYDVTDATFQNVGAGSTITVKATRGSESVSLSFDCPADVTLTPAAGTTVSAGETVTVGWTGNITYENPVGVVSASIIPYDTTTRTFGISPPNARKDGVTGTSVDLTVPPLPGGMDAYVAELGIPGKHTSSNGCEGYCRLMKRNQLAAGVK